MRVSHRHVRVRPSDDVDAEPLEMTVGKGSILQTRDVNASPMGALSSLLALMVGPSEAELERMRKDRVMVLQKRCSGLSEALPVLEKNVNECRSEEVEQALKEARRLLVKFEEELKLLVSTVYDAPILKQE